MKNSKQLTNSILVLTVAALLSACAPRGSDSSSMDQSSRLPEPNGTSSTKALAYCNQAAGTDITAKLRAYVDPSSGIVRMDYMVLRLTALPASFSSGSSYISMWKWLSNASGNTYLDSTPLNFMILNPKTGLALTNWKTTVRWADVSTAASSLGYSDAQSFFNAMKIVVDLKDTQGEYDVLRISSYDVSTNQSLSQVDALMPLFYANPADYAFEPNGSARSSALQALHPFKSQASSGYTSAQFATMSNGYCF